ncbi:hypothetical protein [Allofournierella sp.]|uniref:hypothetical protein n=2 Tax=Allofournierella sp. TaxID=1940256 RepID=UPI003AB8F7B1
MRGRQPARPMPPASAKPASAPCGRQRSAARKRRYTAWKVAALAAGILLAGSLGTYLAAQAIAAPKTAVEQSAALPVRNAVGQKADEVKFLPWQVFDQAAPAPVGEVDVQEVIRALQAPAMALLSCGYTRQAAWEPAAGSSSLPCFSLSDRQGDFAYIQDAGFTVTCQPGPEGLPAAFPALLDVAAGTSPGGLHAAYFVMQLRPDLVTSPGPDQLDAARHAVLQDLYALAGTAGGRLAVPSVAGAEETVQSSSACSLQAMLPFLEGYLGEGSFTGAPAAALSLVRGALDSPDFAELFRDSLRAANPADPEDERIEQALQSAFLAWQSIDFQLVTLDSTILMLFTASYDGSSSALGIYYDPVLACYSGFGIQ